MKEDSYQKLVQVVTNEIHEVLSRVSTEEVYNLVEAIMAAEKVFVFGVGRVFLALKFIAKRLAHLGVDTQVVGSITEKAIGSNDLLLIASGSGESKLPVEISRIAKKYQAKLGLITSATESTIKEMADLVVHLPSPTKNDSNFGVQSVQPMTNLFDQSLHIFGDVLSIIIQNKKGLSDEELWKYHANLE